MTLVCKSQAAPFVCAMVWLLSCMPSEVSLQIALFEEGRSATFVLANEISLSVVPLYVDLKAAILSERLTTAFDWTLEGLNVKVNLLVDVKSFYRHKTLVATVVPTNVGPLRLRMCFLMVK